MFKNSLLYTIIKKLPFIESVFDRTVYYPLHRKKYEVSASVGLLFSQEKALNFYCLFQETCTMSDLEEGEITDSDKEETQSKVS